MRFREGVDRMISKIGQDVTYRSTSGAVFNPLTQINDETKVDEVVKAAVKDYKPQELIGIVQQGDRMVRIAAEAISVVPKEQEKVIIDGEEHTIISVNIRKTEGLDAIYILQVRG